MTDMLDKIIKMMSAHGSRKWVCTPKNFLDFESREAVDQVLSRLIKVGQFRRFSRDLYDMPRISNVLKRPAPVDLDTAIAALARRNRIRIMPNGSVGGVTRGSSEPRVAVVWPLPFARSITSEQAVAA